MIDGTVMDIQRCALDDGPGIRTVIFMKGCHLRCQWCCNPESWSPTPQIRYQQDKCIACHSCVKICTEQALHSTPDGILIDRDRCLVCGRCAEVCPQEALTLSGRKMSVDEAWEIIRKDKTYYRNSGGGVTFSGGEALLQRDFVLELLKRCKAEDIHTCIETCGMVPQKSYGKVIGWTSLFLFDFKINDSELHRTYCGSNNALIKSNLNWIANHEGAQILLRCPIIPNINDNMKHFQAISQWSENYESIVGVELMPYHNYGAPKYTQLGMQYPLKDLESATPEMKDRWYEMLKEAGCTKIVRNFK